MPRGNPSNLVVPTSEQARINGAKGGHASQISQRRKKLLRDYLIELMDKQNPSVIDAACDTRYNRGKETVARI